jgi:toxin ParE1/3/4
VAPRSRPVVWSDAAQEALDEAVAHIARDRYQAAINVLQRALRTAERLSELPERGRIVPEIGDGAVREVFVHRYRLMYRVSPEEVTVIAFLHGARDFEEWRRSQ